MGNPTRTPEDRRHIPSIEEANELLPGFIEKYNKQFAVEPADPESAFAVPWLRKERTATGSTISYHGQKYQLVDEKSSILSLPSKSVIQVLRHLDDSIDAMYRGKDMVFVNSTLPPNRK